MTEHMAGAQLQIDGAHRLGAAVRADMTPPSRIGSDRAGDSIEAGGPPDRQATVDGDPVQLSHGYAP